MEINSAITEAINEVLENMPEQGEEFKKKFRLLVKHVLSGNFDDSEVRDTMESLLITSDLED